MHCARYCLFWPKHGHQFSHQGSKQLVTNSKLHTNVTSIQTRYSGDTGWVNRIKKDSQNLIKDRTTDRTPTTTHLQLMELFLPLITDRHVHLKHYTFLLHLWRDWSCSKILRQHGDYIQCFSCCGYGHKMTVFLQLRCKSTMLIIFGPPNIVLLGQEKTCWTLF